ncbi:hypothetical protein C6M51_05300 [Klebsiella pneumoniae]|nr:hypothetical protein C6M51_05300 [Klebsiella pneumoniae]
MPAFEWVHVQLHQQKGMISLSPPTICNSAHEITYKGKMQDFKFVVTYGMHCFTKDGTPYNIPFKYQDARESISVCLERYEASKQLQHILPNLPSLMLYQTTEEKYFTLQMMNSATNQLEPYKICVAFFKENRLMRIHVLSAFFARTGPGAPGEPIPQKPVSLFKVAVDTAKKPRNSGRPKEVNNR